MGEEEIKWIELDYPQVHRPTLVRCIGQSQKPSEKSWVKKLRQTDETVLEALSWFVTRPGVYFIFYFDKDTWFPARYGPAPALEKGTGKWDIAVLSCGTIIRKWKEQ